MDVSVSVSFFQDELASTIEHAVKAAVDTVLCEITKVVGSKFTEFQMEMAGKERENESLKLRLEISESELKAVRECMNAADADIKQPLRNINPDCNEQDFQRNENQGLFQDPKESRAILKSESQEGPRIEAVYTQEESFDQEWYASLKQDTQLTCVKDDEVPRLECVPIKEEFIEQECVPIAEEVPTENNVCTLEENNQLGSSLCDDCPPECELGFRAFTSTVILPQKRSAQGHGSDLEIYSFHVDCKVTSRFAHNVLTSRMANRANASREVTFDVELPKHAFISNFSMTIDGKTYVGVVKKKEEAKQQYDQAVSRGQSAGLVNRIVINLLCVCAVPATDINAAVLKGVEMLKISKEEKKLPERSVSIIILLTDGDPTSGVTNLEQIQSNIKKGIEGLYTLYCLGFGFDVNYNFLEKLALENGGVARRIYESSDSALQLQGFYEEVATPLLQQVELQYPGNGVSDLTENVFRHYYNGSEIVVAGRISKNDLEILSVQIKAGASSSDLTLTAETPVEEHDEAVKKHKYIFGEYIERLWAYLTIQQLLSKAVSAQPEEREALNEKALQLSLNYNFVTSLTSMVVTKPEEGQTDRTMVAHKPTEAEQGDRVDFSHHADENPRFVIPVKNKQRSVCFEIAAPSDSVILQLISDADSGISQSITERCLKTESLAGIPESSLLFYLSLALRRF
ncbi:UNVERIFIED_CONTAM: hypothetical protein FKN15_014892 [Acipenser sinensis]